MDYYGANRKSIGFDLRVTRLGHVVRGGIPSAADGVLATRLGAAAVDTLASGKHGVLAGIMKGDTVTTPLVEIAGKMRPRGREPPRARPGDGDLKQAVDAGGELVGAHAVQVQRDDAAVAAVRYAVHALLVEVGARELAPAVDHLVLQLSEPESCSSVRSPSATPYMHQTW